MIEPVSRRIGDPVVEHEEEEQETGEEQSESWNTMAARRVYAGKSSIFHLPPTSSYRLSFVPIVFSETVRRDECVKTPSDDGTMRYIRVVLKLVIDSLLPPSQHLSTSTPRINGKLRAPTLKRLQLEGKESRLLPVQRVGNDDFGILFAARVRDGGGEEKIELST